MSSKAAQATSGRDGKGRFAPGWRGGPGRPAPPPEELLFKAAQQLAAPTLAAIDAIELARRCSPQVMMRLVEIAVDEKTEPGDATAAAKVVLERAHGLPVQTNLNLNAEASMTPERQAQAQNALAKLRQMMLGSPQGDAGRVVDASLSPEPRVALERS